MEGVPHGKPHREDPLNNDKALSMASTTTDLRLFGLDLRTLWAQLCAPWRGRSGAALTAWLTPTVVIRLLRRDAASSYWLSGPTPRPIKSNARSARFDAVEIPEAIVLRRELLLPQLSEDQTADAVALEAQGMSPFAPDDLVWGHHARAGRAERRVVELVLASRKQILQALEAQSGALKPGQPAEAWVMAGDSGATPVPIVFSGFGEVQRLRHLAVLRQVCVGLAALAIVLCVCIAVTPTAQLWLCGEEAAAEMNQLKRRVAPIVSEREGFMQSTNRLNTLSDMLSTRVDPLRVMDYVTKVLPDDTTVQILQVQGSKVTINGLTTSVAALMQQLSNEPGLRDVKAPTGANRPQGAQRENYVIEFTLVAPKARPVESAGDKSAALEAAASAVSASSPASAASAAAVANKTPASAAASAPAVGAAASASAAHASTSAPAASPPSMAAVPSASPPAKAVATSQAPSPFAPPPRPTAPAPASPFTVGGSQPGTQGGKP